MIRSDQPNKGKNFTYDDTIDWILDTGTSMHITRQLEYLDETNRIEASYPIQLLNGRTVRAKAMEQV